MGARTTIELDGSGAVVRHRAPAGDRAARERLEGRGRALRTVAGPGVVAVVREGPVGDGGWELVTAYAGTPISAGRLPDGAVVARLGGAVAAILGRVHARGLAHGGLEVEHILVGGDGDPVLCGFAADPDVPPSDDVAALGRILDDLLAELAPPRRAAERRRRSAIGALAASAQTPEAERRPTARRLAADLDAVAGAASRPAARARARPTSSGGPLAGVAVALAAAVAVGAVVWRLGPAGDPATGGDPVTVPPPAPPSSLVEAPRCVASEGHDVPAGGGCAEAITVDGAAVVVDGHRVVVGLPGDHVVAGSWACEGGVRPAVLRPRTGEVLLYAPVVATGGPEVVRAERVAGATGFEVALDDGGCATVSVRAGGTIVRLA